MGRPMLFEFRYSEFSAPTVASARSQVEEQLVQHQEQRADEYSGEERHDDRRMEDLEDRLFRQNCEHQTRAGHEEAETVEHHLGARPAYAHSSGHISDSDYDADDAEAFHRV